MIRILKRSPFPATRYVLAASLLGAAVSTTAAPTAAQTARTATGLPPLPLSNAPVIGSDFEDRARLQQLLGRDSTSGFVLRSLSSRIEFLGSRDTLVWSVVTPELNVVTNSELPFSQNDGALWAGRGFNYLVRAGAALARGPWRLVVAPELVGSANAAFQDVRPGFYRPIINTARYSVYSSPWMQHPFPMDQPFRPGPDPSLRLDAGQSAFWYEDTRLAAGVGTENQWWGPGIRDALILTNNAGGFPHAFVRTARPLRTAVGDFEGRWMVGALSESAYFDSDPDNDSRSLALAGVTYRPRLEPELTLGVSRAVFAAATSDAKALLRWFDVVQPTTRPNSRPWSDTTFTGGRDQLTSVFGRWVFPRAGAEIYGELGRAEWPASLRDFLVDPTHTMGYLMGGQLAQPWARAGAVWRFQGEFTFLERSNSYRYRPTQSWYSSRAAPQGYTQRGQVLGASIGPGSSHQWLALDLISPTWRGGVFAGRWRLNADHNAAIIPYPIGTGSCEYDTTLYPGIRGGYRGRTFGVVNAEVIFANRLNYLYQNGSGCPSGNTMVDVRNTTVRLSVTPARFR
jgi:hypothetical protein